MPRYFFFLTCHLGGDTLRDNGNIMLLIKISSSLWHPLGILAQSCLGPRGYSSMTPHSSMAFTFIPWPEPSTVSGGSLLPSYSSVYPLAISMEAQILFFLPTLLRLLIPYCPQSVFKLPSVWPVGVPSNWHIYPVEDPHHSWSISTLCSSNKAFQAHCTCPRTACSSQWGNDIRDQSLGTRGAHGYWGVSASWPFSGQKKHTNIHTDILTNTNTHMLHENASACTSRNQTHAKTSDSN